MFRKYMHVERYGNDEVQGIELGRCYIFPKLDGTNGSVWYDGGVRAGSRNRELSKDQDNRGFYKHVSTSPEYGECLKVFSHLRLYGEWMVPHTLKTYRDDVWRKFYVFDVFNDVIGEYLTYDQYQPMLEMSGINYIPPLCIAQNVTHDNLLKELDGNGFFIKDGEGVGEGIVIKNYTYKNQFGRTTWAKIMANQFVERRRTGPKERFAESPETKIVDRYVDDHLVSKIYAKITNECGGWNSKYTPRLFSTVYYDLVNEELWNIVKGMKNPTIDFKKLHGLLILKVKSIKPELF